MKKFFLEELPKFLAEIYRLIVLIIAGIVGLLVYSIANSEDVDKIKEVFLSFYIQNSYFIYCILFLSLISLCFAFVINKVVITKSLKNISISLDIIFWVVVLLFSVYLAVNVNITHPLAKKVLQVVFVVTILAGIYNIILSIKNINKIVIKLSSSILLLFFMLGYVQHQFAKNYNLSSDVNSLAINNIIQFVERKAASQSSRNSQLNNTPNNTFQNKPRYLPQDTSFSLITMKEVREYSDSNSIKAIFLESEKLSLNDLEVFTRYKNLRRIDLLDCKFDTIPENWQDLKKLESLSLSRHYLRKIPLSLYKLANLKYLSVEGDSLESISKNIGNLKKLQMIHFGSMTFGGSKLLKELPIELYTLSELEQLDISMCAISDIPKEIQNLEKLEWLFLQQNPLKIFPTVVTKLTNLKRLDLTATYISVIPNDICNLAKLNHFGISNNSLEYIPPCLNNLPYLKEIRLREDDFSTEELSQLRKTFADKLKTF